MNKKVSPLQKLMELYGNASKIAMKLEVDRQVVESWFRRGYIPFKRGELIHEKTDGKVTKNEVWEWANRSFIQS